MNAEATFAGDVLQAILPRHRRGVRPGPLVAAALTARPIPRPRLPESPLAWWPSRPGPQPANQIAGAFKAQLRRAMRLPPKA